MKKTVDKYDADQDDLYDWLADSAQEAKMETRQYDIDNIAKLFLDFGENGDQEGIFKEDMTEEMYNTYKKQHEDIYNTKKEPFLKAFQELFDSEDEGYHKLAKKDLKKRLEKEGIEWDDKKMKRWEMMRSVFTNVNNLKPEFRQVNKNLKVGNKAIAGAPRTNPGHGGTPTGSSAAKSQMQDLFIKSFLGKDRATQENMKRLWDDSITDGSNISRTTGADEEKEPDFYRRKERTQFAGLQAFHKKLQESGFLDDGILDRKEFAALKRDMQYHRDTDIEDHLKLWDQQSDIASGKGKGSWFNKYMKNVLMKEEFDFEMEDDEGENSWDELLEALSILMDSEGGVSSESPRLNFSDFRARIDK